MKRRTAGRSAKPRVCALCGGLMPASRPIYLVHTLAGTIVGPYHSGCAWKLAEESKRRPIVAITEAEKASAYGFMAREETLPW